MRVYQKYVGRSVMVRFNEGRMEGILVDVDIQNKQATVFSPLDHSLNSRIGFDQIVEIGKRIEING